MFFLPLFFLKLVDVFGIAAALLPAIILMIYIYRRDRIEKEPAGLLFGLIVLGMLAGIISIVIETVGTKILNLSQLSPDSPSYAIVMAFLVVAAVEEGAKYVLLKARTWSNPNFNFRFDAIVYSVFVSLGFAAFENVLYIMQYGISVAPVRAILSIPGHMSFAVIMGTFLGRAKLFERYGDEKSASRNRTCAYVFAVLLHGFFDACLMIGSPLAMILFIVFVIGLYIGVFRLVRRESATDSPV